MNDVLVFNSVAFCLSLMGSFTFYVFMFEDVATKLSSFHAAVEIVTKRGAVKPTLITFLSADFAYVTGYIVHM